MKNNQSNEPKPLSRLELRMMRPDIEEDNAPPPDHRPSPEDYLEGLASLLERTTTTAHTRFDVIHFPGDQVLWLEWALSDADEGDDRKIELKITISDEYEISARFYTPYEAEIDEFLEFEREVQIADADDYYEHLNQYPTGEDYGLLYDLDIFEADSTIRLRQALCGVGIYFECPDTSLGDLLGP